ncbi:hypothetical protein [Horticoccus sp. 23ND18S-11]|uniref:hypothetical protein n=1 Tax=Horticoccus sp. 23ND18S-11 TaxID=3391832 RepID=UPI0039C92EAF
MKCAPWFLALAVACTSGHAAETPAAIAAAAQAAHGKRDLGTASALYQQLLTAEPPATPTDEQRAWVTRFAPRLHMVPREFFPLKDIVAIVHPEKPIIAYHLFWEDDFGFPSDNDPCDHEVVWIEFDRATQRVTKVTTYWHGRQVSTDDAVADANSHSGRAWIGVEWGFHGSIPWRAIGQVPAVDEVLRSHWKKAHDVMKTLPRDPLARGWPTEFSGDFAAFTTYTVPFDPRPMLRERGLVYVSRWANATINRYCLRYNFSAKTEWPGPTAP